ncbi:MAG: amidohydrolase family protein [Acidimicrobiales bacterium]|nr:amidohydrolase family protein [Acidimicrobiales bacterium]
MLDVAIRGGTVVDGTGVPGRLADVGIRDGRVVEVGSLEEPARRVIEASGQVVAPGFVDIHTHYDAQVMWDPAVTPSSLHGVTTVIGGNCGFGVAPLDEGAAAYLLPMLARVEGIPLEALDAGVDVRWNDFGSWLDLLEGRVSVNAGFLVGHSVIRRLVMKEAAVGEAASEDQVTAMTALLARSLEQGGLGFSTTLAVSHSDHHGDPVPSRFASRQELLELCRVVGAHEGTTLEMIPTIDPVFDAGVYELMTTVSLTGRRSVNWNLLGVRPGLREQHSRESRLAASDHAARHGGRVVPLLLPDVSRMRLNLRTGFVFDSIPRWNEALFRLPADARLKALSEPGIREVLADGAAELGYRLWTDFEHCTVHDTADPELASFVGRSFGSIAAERATTPLDAMLDLAAADNLNMGIEIPVLGDDDDSWAERIRLASDPRVVLGGTDAGAHLDQSMNFVSFTRFIAEAVRRRQLLSLEQAVHLLTDVPARYYGIKGRGRIRPGWQADIAVWDPSLIGPGEIRGQRDLPGAAWRLTSWAEGIEHVLVNGTPIVQNGQVTGATPGSVLRSGRDTETVALHGDPA